MSNYQALRFFHKFDDGIQHLKPFNGLYYNEVNFGISCNSFIDGTTVHDLGFSIKTPGTYKLSMGCRVKGPRQAMFVIGLGERRLQNIQIRGYATSGNIGDALDIRFDECFSIGQPCVIWIALFADWYEMSLINEQLFGYRGIVGRLEKIAEYESKFDIALIDKDARHSDDQTTTK